MVSVILTSLLALAGLASARDVPSNVQALYESVTSSNCKNKLASGFYSLYNEGPDWSYCGDHLEAGFIYIQGNNKGQLADMDIDCDGAQGGANKDDRCEGSTDTQSQTSFKDTVQSYGVGITDLDAFYHPYVVFGNEGTKSAWATFDPEEYGIEPLSVMAVVCGGKMFFGIWGDENGDDGENPMVGEASISMATLCFGTEMTGNNGYDGTDVLYLAFTGSDAVPGADGASWTAENPVAFEESISTIGQSLLERINDGDAEAELPIVKVGANPSARLGRCEGDCDNDGDCESGLRCFQRTGPFESVPGCSGGAQDDSLFDYCVRNSDEFPTLTQVAVNPSAPLERCQGDCDRDSDCAGSDLFCFPRSKAGELVPGCHGGELDSTLFDYCIRRVDAAPDGVAPTTPTPVPSLRGANPTHRPTPAPVSNGPSLPSGELPIVKVGANPSARLGRCEGDCDNDGDCESGLRCFARTGPFESVPGCSGGAQDDSLFDYCVQNSDNFPALTQVAVNPSVPLERCQGDCDSDSDCAGSDLFCFPRSKAGESVPGCYGGELDSTLFDYCIRRVDAAPDGVAPTTPATPVPSPRGANPTHHPTAAPVSSGPSSPSGELPIVKVGANPSARLGRCEGDCDNDGDCESGLRCFARTEPFEAVPGCSGGAQDDSRFDYCVRINDNFPSLTQVAVNPSVPLGRCQGDCDSDTDCAGSDLFCFPRSKAGELVPGCHGGELDSTLFDYCIRRVDAAPGVAPTTPKPELVFAEEFNEGDQPNPAVWTYDLGDGGWGNDELQRYTNLKENVQISPNGKLVITALQQGDSFTSGRIKTLNKFKFKYGSVEASIKVPDLRSGLWPAFWTMGNNVPAVGWPKCGEIDMIEMGYGEPGNSISNHLVGSTAHWFNDPAGTGAMYGLYLDVEDDLSQAFHTFSMDWTPNMITTYLDGKQIWAIDISPDSEQCPPEQCSELHDFHFILLNMAVGGEYTGLFSPDQISAHFPARYEIDYVRVYANDWTEVGGSYINGDPTAKYYLTDCGCPATCTSQQLDRIAEDSTSGSSSCRERIEWVIENQDSTEEEACQTVSGEFPSICGQACNPDAC